MRDQRTPGQPPPEPPTEPPTTIHVPTDEGARTAARTGRAAGEGDEGGPAGAAGTDRRWAAGDRVETSAPDGRSGDPGPRLPGAWRLWGLAFAVATVLGLASAFLYRAGVRLALDRSVPGGQIVQYLSDWYLWALITPGIIWLARRFPVESERPVRGVALHSVLGTSVAAVELLLFTVFNRSVLGANALPTFGKAYAFVLGRWLTYALLIYGVIVAAVHVFEYYRRYRERELRASRLEAQLVGAQLRALRMQLHPHFLFNTLNTISVFMRDRRGEEAIDMVAALGDLLRKALERVGDQEVPLVDELEFARKYLEIERARFDDRLDVRFDVQPDTLEVPVPNMVLQPLLENAMRHGVAATSGGCRVRVTARDRNGWLELEVRDDGPGLEGEGVVTEAGPSGGLGLRNTAARLRCLYGDAARLELRNAPSGGASVRVTLPIRRRAARAGADR